jgi:hypothetical protein
MCWCGNKREVSKGLIPEEEEEEEEGVTDAGS